jgi:DNA-binding transcriptional regulator YhcF (GntR family)
MNFNFDTERPIYIQIMDIIKNNIIRGEYLPGSKLPSVRELSTLFKVNPNTIVKSLYFLENEGLIYTDRTNGKFITNDMSLRSNNKKLYLELKLNNFLNDLKSMGYNKEDVIKLLMEANH